MSGLDSVFPILVAWFDFSSKFNCWSAKVWSLSHLWFPVSVKSQVWFNDYALPSTAAAAWWKQFSCWRPFVNEDQQFFSDLFSQETVRVFQWLVSAVLGHRLESQRVNSAGETWFWLWQFIILRQFMPCWANKKTTKTSACIMSLWISTTSAKRAIHKPYSHFARSKYV